MGLTSLQVCIDSSDWLQGTIHEESGMDDSSSPSAGDMLTCTRPLIERRLRPPHDQALKCPRCDSTHTKFCYYNNYSLSQPRYFCKTCRRYWTKGGTLRNIPVGGGCRKNKKVSSKKSSSASSSSNNDQVHLVTQNHHPDLSFPEMHFSHFSGFGLGDSPNPNPNSNPNPTFLLENPAPIDFIESKYEALAGLKNHDFMGTGHDLAVTNNVMGGFDPNLFHGYSCSPFGSISLDHHHHHGSSNGGAALMDTCQRLMLPYESNNNLNGTQNNNSNNTINNNINDNDVIDIKPNTKLLSLEWQDQGCNNSDAGKDSFGYLGSWTGFMNGYGLSTTNPLV